jgi:hypothetical protein
MSAKRGGKRMANLPAEEENNGSLTRLSGEVEGAFEPVQPRAAFKEHLADGLQQTMRHKANLRVAEPGHHHSWILVAGATIGSLIPLLGLVAYLLRSRLVGKPRQATCR